MAERKQQAAHSTDCVRRASKNETEAILGHVIKIPGVPNVHHATQGEVKPCETKSNADRKPATGSLEYGQRTISASIPSNVAAAQAIQT